MDGWSKFRGALLVSIGAAAFACGKDRPPTACESPMDVMQAAGDGQQVPTGWQECSNGFAHRPEQRECLYPTEIVGTCNGQGTETDPCSSDEDCTAQPHGYCNVGNFLGGCYCSYGCESDADCGEDQACYCFGPASYCVPASCHTDDDCQPGYLCTLLSGVLACQTPDDGCRTPDECESGSCPVCQYKEGEDAWQCNPDGGACTAGRPFLVDGRARTAAAIATDTWCSVVAREPDALDDDTRALLAAHWTEVALAEHASVPAFARFALELAALAAPAELLAECARAMSDEIDHARLAFTLASRYLGAAIGPGPLAVGDALPRRVELVAVAAEV
ncbi:MAG TPA: hypothetical protein VG755_29180, partial [Nannocystaceae bacterium]|nr:hypothetical protein [Nannocystaceae bacterium]